MLCQALKARSLVRPNHHSFRYVPLLQYEDVRGQSIPLRGQSIPLRGQSIALRSRPALDSGRGRFSKGDSVFFMKEDERATLIDDGGQPLVTEIEVSKSPLPS